jgi:hypothetical protein
MQAAAVAVRLGADAQRCDQNHSWIENFRVFANCLRLRRVAWDPFERRILAQLAKPRRREAMFAGQQPYRTWPQALPPPDDPSAGARGTESRAKSNGVSSGAGRTHWLLVVVGLVAMALASVGFLATVVLRPRAAPETAAVLPPLVSAAPSLTAEAPSSSNQTIEPERLSGPEPAPIQIGVSHEASLEAAPPPLSTTILMTPPSPRDAVAPDVLTPLPPSRPLAFEPPVKPATGYEMDGCLRLHGAQRVSARRYPFGSPFRPRGQARRPALCG